jgi:CheY-like chemotaxis protein
MPHILFIHPDHKLIGIYQRHLGSHFTIDSAHDGLSGLRKIKYSKPRMIISENELRFLSGLALLKFVRSHPVMHRTPFIFLTNSIMPDEALGLGANAWLNQQEHGPEQLFQHLYLHHYALNN